MTKKEYILAVIDALPEWEMGRGIKAMVQNNQLDENTIDMLVPIFKKAMDKIAKTIKEKKIIETIQAKEKINDAKKKQAAQDAETLNRLDSMLNNL